MGLFLDGLIFGWAYFWMGLFLDRLIFGWAYFWKDLFLGGLIFEWAYFLIGLFLFGLISRSNYFWTGLLERHISDALSPGAFVQFWGKRLDGLFHLPTVLTNCSTDMMWWAYLPLGGLFLGFYGIYINTYTHIYNDWVALIGGLANCNMKSLHLPVKHIYC